jgi:hypothetical protein
MPSPTRSRRPRALTAALLVTASLLAACTDPNAPRPAETTTITGQEVTVITWPIGAPDTTNPWITALYDAETATALAINAGNFSLDAFTSTTTPEYALKFAATIYSSALTSGHGVESIYPGPLPFVVTSLTETDDGATIEICGAVLWTRDVGSSYPPVRLDEVLLRDYGNGSTFFLVQDDDTGAIKVADATRRTSEPTCSTEGLRPGFFTPAPVVDADLTPEQIIGPEGRPISDYPHDDLDWTGFR